MPEREVRTVHPALVGQEGVDSDAILDAIAALAAASELLDLLGGGNDVAALADPFGYAADALRVAAFGQERDREPGDEDGDERDPLFVELEARSQQLLAKPLKDYGLLGLASRIQAHADAVRAEGSTAAGVRVEACACPPYLPGEHSETLGFIYTLLDTLELDRRESPWGRMLAAVQEASGKYVPEEQVRRLEELEVTVANLRGQIDQGRSTTDA